MRLWYPSLVSASSTRWFAVSPGVPLLVRRSPGATYTSHPRIGLMPRLRAWSWNTTDENMFPCSVMAIAGIFSSTALSSSSSIRHAPSSSENSEWRWRWTNSVIADCRLQIGDSRIGDWRLAIHELAIDDWGWPSGDGDCQPSTVPNPRIANRQLPIRESA